MLDDMMSATFSRSKSISTLANDSEGPLLTVLGLSTPLVIDQVRRPSATVGPSYGSSRENFARGSEPARAYGGV